MHFLRRIGPDPHAGKVETPNLSGCPDIWELDDGSFAVIGRRATNELRSGLPPTAGCGPDEEIIIVPRGTLVEARGDIPMA